LFSCLPFFLSLSSLTRTLLFSILFHLFKSLTSEAPNHLLAFNRLQIVIEFWQ
jgi:hypothetical protein